jgi:hypothetical protein
MILLHVSWGVSVEVVERDDRLELLILASAGADRREWHGRNRFNSAHHKLTPKHSHSTREFDPAVFVWRQRDDHWSI